MKIVIAPDSFKETMSAKTVAKTMASAVKEVWPEAQCVEVPMADGGEGTTESLVDALGGERRDVAVLDALGRNRTAQFGWIPQQGLAVMEVAQAIGIEHICPDERDPKRSGTAGVGMMLNHILDLSPRKIIIGLGGSATNDGGWGMCHELGVRLKTVEGCEIDPFDPLQLRNASVLDASALDPRWRDVEIILACDVNNPLTGDTGATRVFGPQKGVLEVDLASFDAALSQWGSLIDEHSGEVISQRAGAGAAGGLGAAFMAFLGADNRSGIDVVIETVGLRQVVADADLVFTGEGGIDFQTKFGKTPWGVMLVAREHNIPTIAFAGKLGKGLDSLYDGGFAAIVPTVREVTDLKTALAQAQPSLFEAVKMTCQILNAKMHGWSDNASR
ncbi:glycerate kinase [Arcanobacterium bovis]|uniref:Glycerate kinase n=1 Tax=Arcanobacterium bovis TaxID=2529275 RepID=A0A4Q9V143_9ACTO|nr:glycerate kinase [Arcanobacterium bovis]TBW22806.1 glycerate kinase [Arcanobacterium bovis]